MSKPSPPAGSERTVLGRPLANRGFALVVTISLMVLMTILGIGMLSLSAISMRQSRATSHLATARANARLALVMALGQLQKHAGDDRRITMAADQQSSSGDGDTSSASDERRRWTGVYRAWDHTLEARPDPEFLSWLVSSPDPDGLGEDAPSATTTSGDSIELVGPGTVGDSKTDHVSVPLISLKDGKGRLAWWTGDQGLKAMLAIPKQEEATDMAGVRAKLQASPGNAMGLVTTGTETPFTDIHTADDQMAALTGWGQTDFVATSPEAAMPLFHDIAVRSSGLLTNVRAGGFRRDLSMELERTNRDAPTAPLYTVGREPGINLQELWVYYNLYKEVRSARGRYTTGGSIPARANGLTMMRNAEACKSDDEHFFKQPVITSYQMVFSLETRPVTANGRTVNRLQFVADPILTFWNPLDVPVVLPTTAFLTVKYWMIPYDLRIRTSGGFKRCPLMMALTGAGVGGDGDYNYLSLQAGELQQLVFKPGEVIKVSQSGDKIVKGTSNIGHSLNGRSGFNYGGGVSLPVRDENGAYIDLRGTETVYYEFVPNSLTCGKTSSSGNSISGRNRHSRHFSLNHHEYYVGTDRGSNSVGVGGMYIDWDFGNRRLQTRQMRQSNSPGTKPSRDRLYANRFPQIFKRFTTRDGRPLSASELASRKAPVLLVSYNAKTENSSDLFTKSLARFNPKAHHVDFYDLSQTERDMLPYEFKIEPLVSWKNRSLEVSPQGNAYFGGGLDAATGTRFITTHSVPREPLSSLAALQHSFANGFNTQKPIYGYATLNGREPLLPQISHAIGNSHAPSILPPDKTKSTISGSRPVADHSYLANRALFDDWFFSTIAPHTSTEYSMRRGQADIARDFLENGEPLANSRYVPSVHGRNVDDLLRRLFRGSKPNVLATDLVASLMRVEGMFNVNSTSVEAWKAVLAGLDQQSVTARDESGQVTIKPTPAGIPVAGLMTPTDQVADGGSVTDPSQWVGRRVLNEDEIQELAEAIVREVRRRGPFLSLADFVNRRVGYDKDLAKAGVIQSALDSDSVSINEDFRFGARGVPSDTAGRFAFPDAEEGPISEGIAGIVKQADILTPIAPILSARSDSFIIRAYGEATNSDGAVLAKAWCEAVVERDNNYLYGEDEPEIRPDRLRNPANKTFGRAFRVISFRWLGPDDA